VCPPHKEMSTHLAGYINILLAWSCR